MLSALTELREQHCWCGIVFGVPSTLFSHHQAEKGHQLFCPLGHAMVTKGKSWSEEIADLKLQIQTKDNLLDTERKRLGRLVNRVRKGVCAFCNRSFGNLREHMTAKHKE